MVFKKIVKFLYCFIVWIKDFSKKLRYLKSKISTKFHRLLFLFFFLVFLAFCFLFHLPKLVQKLWIFLWSFIGRVGDFTNGFWKILKVLLKKNILICEICFFQNSEVYDLFFYFFITFDILCSISSICTCQKILEIFMFFYFMD